MSKPPDKSEDVDYENITYCTFKGVGYERAMRWEAGSGRIVTKGAPISTYSPSSHDGIVPDECQSTM